MGVLSVGAALELATLLLKYRLAVFEALPPDQKAAKAAAHEGRLAAIEGFFDKVTNLIDKDNVKA